MFRYYLSNASDRVELKLSFSFHYESLFNLRNPLYIFKSPHHTSSLLQS